MEYDIEILMPVCRRYIGRINDFKKYGLLNIKERKVLITLITSNEQIEDLEKDWPAGVNARTRPSANPDHISNLYRFYAELRKEDVVSKWIMRLDDDSCTDIDGLLSNLDDFYDWQDKFYLGDLNKFEWAVRGMEGELFPSYKYLLGSHERIALSLENEVECGIISYGGIIHMLSSERCMNLIRKRTEMTGGYGDCIVAIAAALSKLYPVQCPFITQYPQIFDFSLFGGVKNHIHLISREAVGDNFENRGPPECFKIVTKFVDNKTTETEKAIMGKRFLQETDEFVRIFDFRSNYSLKIKFEEHIYNWLEEDGFVKIIQNNELSFRLSLQEDGTLKGDNILLRPI